MSAPPPRDFRLFWLGQSASSLGDAFAIVAMPLLVFDATRSVVAMGTVTAVASAGQVVAGTVSGVIVDRVHRRRLMIACDVLRMALFAALPGLLRLNAAALPTICAVTALTAVASNLFSVGYLAAIPNLVEATEVARANGRLQATNAVTYVVGSALAGLVCSQVGAPWALEIDAVSFAASALSLSVIAFRSDGAVRAPTGHTRALRDGLAFLVRHPVLRPLAIFQSAVALLGSIGVGAAVVDLLIYRLKSDFGASAATIGAVMALSSVGAVIGAVTASRAHRTISLGAIAVAGTTFQALGMVAMGLGGNVAM